MRTNKLSGPVPSGIEYHDHIASQWTQRYKTKSFSHRLCLFCSILDRNIIPGETWLDLGCGSGVLTQALLDRKALITAVDGSSKMLQAAQAFLGSDQSSQVQWILSDVQVLTPLEDNSFDGILCSSVIEYANEPALVLDECFRILRPSGKLIISFPPTWSFIRTFQKFLRIITSAAGLDIFEYLSVSRFELPPSMITIWFDQAGFELKRLTSFDPALSNLFLSIMRPSLMILETIKKAG